MKNTFEQESGESKSGESRSGDDEVGQPIWKTPDVDEDEHQEDEEDKEDDFEISRIPPSSEVGIHAPGFDPSMQREWEESERIRREEAERNEKNPRGYLEMK